MCSKKVAIIGAGQSGLVSAKYCIQNGLKPVVFEKTNRIGGLWAGNGTAIWDGLFANISRYTMVFSDHPWPKDSNMFPSSNEVGQYLQSYTNRFKINEHINLNTKVEQVNRLKNNKWEIETINLDSSKKTSEIFDKLIIASGLHSKPRLPIIENLSKFKGLQLHSSKFKLNDPNLKSKKVIVLGCSLSATEISASLVNHAQSVTNIFPRAYLVTPRLVKYKLYSDMSKNIYSIQPIDLFLNKRSFNYPPTNLSKEEARQERKDFFTRLLPYQTNKTICHPALYYDMNAPNQEFLFSISDDYIPFVQKGLINPIQSRVKKILNEKNILLENGSVSEADAIIYCTGYDLDINYLDKSVLETIKYSNEDHKFSLLLYKCTFHPNIDNFAMIGQTDGLFYAGGELQSKWASSVFSDKMKLPDKNLMLNEIKKDEVKRNLKRKSQYPYGNHIQLIDKLANELNLLPNMNELKKSDLHLYDLFWNTSAVSANFIFKDNKNLALNIMNEVHEINQRTYESQSDDMSMNEVIERFSQFYKIQPGLFKNKF